MQEGIRIVDHRRVIVPVKHTMRSHWLLLFFRDTLVSYHIADKSSRRFLLEAFRALFRSFLGPQTAKATFLQLSAQQSMGMACNRVGQQESI